MSRRRLAQMRLVWEPNTLWEQLPSETPCIVLLSQMLEAVVEADRKPEEANDEREVDHPSS